MDVTWRSQRIWSSHDEKISVDLTKSMNSKFLMTIKYFTTWRSQWIRSFDDEKISVGLTKSINSKFSTMRKYLTTWQSQWSRSFDDAKYLMTWQSQCSRSFLPWLNYGRFDKLPEMRLFLTMKNLAEFQKLRLKHIGEKCTANLMKNLSFFTVDLPERNESSWELHGKHFRPGQGQLRGSVRQCDLSDSGMAEPSLSMLTIMPVKAYMLISW
jgi:hypothetical protein